MGIGMIEPLGPDDAEQGELYVGPTQDQDPDLTTGTPKPPAQSAPGAGKVEPLTPADMIAIRKGTAVQLPLWRQIMDPIAEQAPTIAGATGGALAFTAATPAIVGTGPVGPAVAAVAGAGAAAPFGEQFRQWYRSATGQEPHPDLATSLSLTGQAMTSQMLQEGTGQTLGALLRLRSANKHIADISKQYGLNLSAPEISGSIPGRMMQRTFTY